MPDPRAGRYFILSPGDPEIHESDLTSAQRALVGLPAPDSDPAPQPAPAAAPDDTVTDDE